MKQRIALLVYVDLDPVPGAFNTEDSARNNVAGLLERDIDHYNPIVAHAPESLQPPNHPRNMEDSQEIPRLSTYDRPLDLVFADIPGLPNYTEGTN